MNAESSQNDETSFDEADQDLDNEPQSVSEPVTEDSHDEPADQPAEEEIARNPLELSDEEVMAMDAPDGGDRGDESPEPADDAPESKASDDQPTKRERTDSGDEAESEEVAKNDEPTERDIASEHAKIFAPIKANGQEITLNSAEEAISLIQQGMNYHKKMEAISGNMKTIKTLQKAGIDADKLNYLIDLHNKDPKAISKLVSDAKIDPLDLDTEDTEQYRPKNYAPSKEDLALESVLEELESTPTYNRLLNVVGEQWDDESRGVVALDTEKLRTINTHIERGVYDIIEKEMGRQRALGQLRGVSDIAAYQQVGQAIQAAGGFDHLSTQSTVAGGAVQGTSPSPQQAALQIRPGQGSSNPNLNAKRRAASPTKAASTAKAPTNKPNPLAMDDADFEKQMGSILP